MLAIRHSRTDSTARTVRLLIDVSIAITAIGQDFFKMAAGDTTVGSTPSKKDCASCIRTNSCQTGFKSTVIGKHIVRSAYQEIYEKVLKNINEQDFIDSRNERFWKGEGIFAEAKNNHLLGQTRYRGLDKTQVQTTIIATVQNIKRLIKHYENNRPK